MSGLSSAASSACHYPSGFSPEFFKPLPPRAGVAAAEGISYPLKTDQTVSQFQQSSHFADFKKEFLAHIECIKQFAWEHLGDSAHEVCGVFDEFATRVFDTEYAYYAGQEGTLYGEGKRSLEQFCRQLMDPDIDLAHRQNCVLQLAASIQNCASGAAINLALATRAMQEMKGSQFRRIRNEVAMALIMEAYGHLTAGKKPIAFTIHRDDEIIDRISASYEIHFVTFLRNALAENLGLETLVDTFPQKCWFSTEAVEYCRQYVLPRLTPARLVMALAEQYLDAFRRPVVEALEHANGQAGQATPYDCHAPIDYERWRGQFNDVQEDLKSYGEINMYSLITQDAAYPNVRLHADPTLVALDILKEQQHNGFVDPSYVPETIVDWRHAGARISVHHLADELAWAVENDKARLLTDKHLMLLSPKDFAGREKIAKLILANVIKNTPPETLQANLSLAWLSIADTTAVFSKWTPDALSRYLKRHTAHIAALPRLRKLAIAKGIIACGGTTDLALCVAHGRPLFEAPPAPMHPPPFLRIALLRGDAPMFGALINRLEEGLMTSTGIREQLARIFASADEYGVPALFEIFHRSQPNPLLSDYYRIVVDAAAKKLITPEQLETILAAKNARQTPALALLMENNDCEKLRDFGVVLMDAYHQLGGERFAALLTSASANGIPAFLIAVHQEHAEAMIAFGSTVVAAHENGIRNQMQVYELLAAEVGNEWSTLRCAAAKGKTVAVAAFGKVMHVARQKEALSNLHIYMLLRGPAEAPRLVLESALIANEAETAMAIGELLLDFFMARAIERDQLCCLLSGATKESTQTMIDILPSPGRDAAIDALGSLILLADDVRRQKDGAASLPLAAPDACKVILPTSLAKLCSKEGLDTLRAAMATVHSKLQSGQLSETQIQMQIYILELHMQRSRLGLFFTAEDVRERMNAFAGIEQQWQLLNELLQKNEHAARQNGIG